MEFLRLSLIPSGVKEALQDAVVVVVKDNYANVYHGVREGYSGGYYTEGYGFEEAVDTVVFFWYAWVVFLLIVYLWVLVTCGFYWGLLVGFGSFRLTLGVGETVMYLFFCFGTVS